MKLTLTDTSNFRDAISIMSDLVTEARFTISKSGIDSVAIDPANAAMVVLKIFPTLFAECDVKDTVKVSINLANLKQILKRTKADDILTIEMEENKLKLTLSSSSKRVFHLPLLDFDDKEQKIPNLSFRARVDMPSDQFVDIINDVDIVGESVVFTTEKNRFLVSSEGDQRKAKIEIPSSDSVKIITEKEKIKNKYSIEYLKKMTSGSKVSKRVSIMMNERDDPTQKDYPVEIGFNEIDKVSLKFILAPRVDEN